MMTKRSRYKANVVSSTESKGSSMMPSKEDFLLKRHENIIRHSKQLYWTVNAFMDFLLS